MPLSALLQQAVLHLKPWNNGCAIFKACRIRQNYVDNATAVMVLQVSVDNVIGELEDARRSAEADENAVLQLQSQLSLAQAAVAQVRCELNPFPE